VDNVHDQPGFSRCPRCFYDLRGIVATWDDSCPMRGVCSECGLEFAWRDVCDPLADAPLWCIEYAPHSLMRSAARTWRASWTGRLWRELRLPHAVRWRRIALYLLILVPIMYFGITIAQGTYAACHSIESSYARVAPGRAFIHAALWPFSSERPPGGPISAPRVSWRWWTQYSVMRHVVTGVGVMMFATPLAFAALPVTRRVALVRWTHIARIFAYEWPVTVPLLILFTLILAPSRFDLDLSFIPATVAWRSLFAITAIGVFFVHVVWWWRAAKDYLRLDHAGFVAGAVAAIGALAGAVVVYLLFESAFIGALTRLFYDPFGSG